MTDDGDETRPGGPPRSGALAASTLRALRAGRGGAVPPTPDEPAEADAADDAVATGAAEAPDASPADVEVGTAPTHVVRLVDDEPVDEVAASDEVVPVGDVATPDTDDEVDSDTAENVEIGADETRAPRSRRGRLLTVACAVLAVAALVFAVVAGVVWWTAGHSAQHKLGVARQAVSKDAQLAIVTVNTSDYRHPSAALSNWLDASTGALHSEFSQSRSAAVKLLAKAETVTKANVLGEAVTSIDLSKGTASVIASVNVNRTHDGTTSTVRNRFRATMTRVGGQWKLSNLTVVAVALS